MDHWVLYRPTHLWKSFEKDDGERCPFLVRVFESKRRCVVLSRSNKAESEVNLDFCAQAQIPVLSRRGGGGTVVLGPGCQILTLAFFAQSLFSNETYFKCINDLWSDTLRARTGLDIVQRGISDLAVGDRKIAGTSLFRRKHLVVFQGSLLVDPDLKWIDRALLHPSREPDYRNKRSHLEFVTSLKGLGAQESAFEMSAAMQSILVEKLPVFLGQHMRAGW